MALPGGACEAALLVLGETRSKHSGVISAFHRLVVHGSGLEPVIGGKLAALFSMCGQADYSGQPVPKRRRQKHSSTPSGSSTPSRRGARPGHHGE